MRNDGMSVVAGASVALTALASGFVQAAMNGIAQAKADRVAQQEAALEAAHAAGVTRAHIDTLKLAFAAVERIHHLEHENAILRNAVAFRDRALRARANA